MRDSVTEVAPYPARPVVTPVATALPIEVERQLAELVGIEPVVGASTELADPAADLGYDEATATQFARRVLQVAQKLAVGSLVLLVGCAIAAERISRHGFRVHPVPLTLWAVGAAVSGVGLSALVTDPEATLGLSRGRRRMIGGVLMVALVVAITGVVSNAEGLAAPTWVLFLPVVVVAGAVLGPGAGLAVGALAASGIYTAAGLTHTLDGAGLGRLIVILPACPLFGWASGALARCAREAVVAATDQRLALEHDVTRLGVLLQSVSAGDLSQVPSLDDAADQATATLAVVFADTVLSLRRLVRQLNGVVDQLAVNASDLAGSATANVAAVEQQGSAVAETTSTIEELAATALTIAETAERVATFAGSTRRDVDLGVRSVERSTESMVAIGVRVEDLGRRTRGLDERVAEIGTTAKLIDELGRRTTMLALNASIEAARVGEHGQGFGTVAAEIGRLADRARQATGDIAALVAELEREVVATDAVNREGVAAVAAGLARQRVVEDALGQIGERVDDTTRAARDITGATQQQRLASEGVVAAMHQVTGSSLLAMQATRGHAAAASRLHDLADTLLHAVARFRVE